MFSLTNLTAELKEMKQNITHLQSFADDQMVGYDKCNIKYLISSPVMVHFT